MPECECEPWVTVSMSGCGLSDEDGNVACATCPSRLIPVVGDRIGETGGSVS